MKTDFGYFGLFSRCAVVVGLVVVTGGCRRGQDVGTQSQSATKVGPYVSRGATGLLSLDSSAATNGPPIIRCNPEWQDVEAGSNALFTVDAEQPILPSFQSQLAFQWERQGPWETNFTSIDGATNSFLRVLNVTTTNGPQGPAYFRVTVSSTNGSATSLAACLLVWTTNSPLRVFGSPYPSSRSGTGCPGAYVARVDYRLSASQGYGWKPDHGSKNATHIPSDPLSTVTKIEIGGDWDDYWCTDHTGINTHAGRGSNATGTGREDAYYQFSIYFPSLPASLGSYPIRLEGYLDPNPPTVPPSFRTLVTRVSRPVPEMPQTSEITKPRAGIVLNTDPSRPRELKMSERRSEFKN